MIEKKNRTKFFSKILINMLNLLDKKTKNPSADIWKGGGLNFFTGTDKQNNVSERGETKLYPTSTKEWFNSIYSYNKNNIKTLPIVDKIVNKLIKSYFNLSALYNNKKSRRIEVRFKRLSLNRILVSRAEMKHTNNKVIITVYLYNKNQKFFLYKLKNLYETFLFRLQKKTPSLPRKRNTRAKSLGKEVNKSYFSKKMYTQRAHFRKLTIIKKTREFNSKRFKKSQKMRYEAIKTNYSKNFRNLTKKTLNRYILNLKYHPLTLKNKYKTLINKYYFLLSNNKIKTLNNENYFLNSVNLANINSSVNKDSTLKNIKTSNLSQKYGINVKKESYYTTKLNDKNRGRNNQNKNYFSLLLPENEVNSLHFENLFALNKSRKPRNIKNFIYKLRNLHKLFFISKMYNLAPDALNKSKSIVLNESSPNILIVKNIHKILKKKTLALKSSKVAVKKKDNKVSHLTKINYILLKGLRIWKKARKNKTFLVKTLKWNNNNILNYETKYFNKFINKSYRKEILYLYYVKMLSVNHNKFKNWFILGLKRIISKIYGKKVEFNLVNLKYLHLNSNIFSESIAIKLRNRENRLLRVLKKALKLVKLPPLNKLSFYDKRIHNQFINKFKTLNLNSDISSFKDKDILQDLLYKIYPNYKDKIESTLYSASAKPRKYSLQEKILISTSHKNIYGVRLEAHGRLSRRLTASRSVFKLIYKGSLKDLASSYKKLSSVILRGNAKSNIQLTKISSKTRNGSFGLKGWISSN
jgi:hypothetical protein